MKIAFRASGEAVVWRSRPGGEVASVIPATVVHDGAEVTVLYQAPGVVCKRRSGLRGGPQGRGLVQWDGSHQDRVWTGPPTLRLHPAGQSYAVIRRWDFNADRAYGWYVNLESPWRRTRIGFDSWDLILDVTVADDLSSWAWKDADELDWGVSVGKLSVKDAEEIREAGRLAVDALERRAWPFGDDWSAFRPDLNWPVPTLPDGWNDPRL